MYSCGVGTATSRSVENRHCVAPRSEVRSTAIARVLSPRHASSIGRDVTLRLNHCIATGRPPYSPPRPRSLPHHAIYQPADAGTAFWSLVMTEHHRITLALAAIFVSPLAAQFVNPPSAFGVEAPSRFGTPFSNSTTSSTILHEIHGLSAITGLNGFIVQVGWRRDNDTAVASPNYVAFAPDFQLALSTSPRTTQSISQDFATNRGADYALVHNGIVSFPAQAKVPNTATPFAYAVPLATPFPYSSSNGDLLVEVVTNGPVSNPNTSLFFCDASSESGGGTSRTLGSPCGLGSANSSLVYSNWGPGMLARILQYNGPSSVPSSLTMGTTSPVFAGSLLPFDLGTIGAPGCLLQHDVAFGAWVGQTSSTGRLEFRIEIPLVPALGGQMVRAQYLNLGDTGAGNPGNLSLTAGHEITLATPAPGVPAISEAHASFTGGGSPPATAALVQQGYGKVAEFIVR